MIKSEKQVKQTVTELNANLPRQKIKVFSQRYGTVGLFIIGIGTILFAYPIGEIMGKTYLGANEYYYDEQKAFYYIVSFWLSGSLICLWALTRKSS